MLGRPEQQLQQELCCGRRLGARGCCSSDVSRRSDVQELPCHTARKVKAGSIIACQGIVVDAGRVVELIHLCLSVSSGNRLGKRHVDIKFERRHATLEVFQRHGPDPPMAFRRSVAIVSSMARLLSVSLMPALMEFAASYKDLASVMAMAPVALLSVTLVARKDEMIHDTNVDAKAVVPNMQAPSADGGSAHVDPLGASICGGKPGDDYSFVWGLIKFCRFGLPMRDGGSRASNGVLQVARPMWGA